MNTLIKFECPGCGQSMEGEPDLEFQETTCPSCAQQFFPKPLKTLDAAAVRRPVPGGPSPAEKAAAARINATPSRADKIRQRAVTFYLLAGLCLLCGVLALAVALEAPLTGNGIGDFSYVKFWLGAALAFYLVAQVIHIRANTEK